MGRRRAQSSKITNSLTPWKPSWATNGQTLLAFGTAHDLPRRTQSPERVVVDGRPPAARGDHRAGPGRHHPVAGGESAGGDPDRARSLPLLQPPHPVPAAFLHRDDRGVVPVTAADPPQRADRVRGLDRADRGDAFDPVSYTHLR